MVYAKKVNCGKMTSLGSFFLPALSGCYCQLLLDATFVGLKMSIFWNWWKWWAVLLKELSRTS